MGVSFYESICYRAEARAQYLKVTEVRSKRALKGCKHMFKVVNAMTSLVDALHTLAKREESCVLNDIIVDFMKYDGPSDPVRSCSLLDALSAISVSLITANPTKAISPI